MKRIFLLTLFTTLGFISFSQSNLSLRNLPNANAKSAPFNKGKDDCSPLANNPSNGIYLNFNSAIKKSRGQEVIIGNTTYDYLPSNQRIFPGANGKLSAVWTGSTWVGALTDPNVWPDRGTFANFFDGTSWGPIPTARLESVRTGFPSVVNLANGSEWACSHIPVDTVLDILTRPVSGTGSWSVSGPSNLEVMWPHATAWGNYIHVIGSNNKWPGNNYMKYSRSSDGGVSWDIENLTFPQIDTANCFNSMSAENYGIDARNHTVGVIGGGSNNSIYLWKSTDDGTNWVRSTIWNFALCGMDGHKLTDVNGDGVIDTLETSDGSYAIIIDNNNMVHCWFGYTRVLDTDTSHTTAGNGWNYFPGWNALMYWNETFGPDSFQIIGRCPDIDGDGTLDQLGSDLPNYGVSLASMPTVAMDTTNNIIYCVFATPIENTDLFNDPANSSAQSFRDLFGIYSTDNGLSWSNQVNLTNTATLFLESVYPCASKYTRNGNVDLMWMRDTDPSYSLDDSQVLADGVHSNDIVFNTFNMAAFNGVKTINQDQFILSLYPNPSSGLVYLDFTGLNANTGAISFVNLLGQTVKTFAIDNLDKVVKLNATDLVNGIYFVTVKTIDQVFTQKVNITHE